MGRGLVFHVCEISAKLGGRGSLEMINKSDSNDHT